MSDQIIYMLLRSAPDAALGDPDSHLSGLHYFSELQRHRNRDSLAELGRENDAREQ